MEITLNMISGKWKPFIITSLLSGPSRPRDLIDEHPEFTKRVLMQQLRELEIDGLVEKKLLQSRPLVVEYALTETGKALQPLVTELNKFGDRYKSQAAKPHTKQ
jgi:DNA-binding HxlR family transcriptional regulator